MSVNEWAISISDPIADQIVGVPSTGTHDLFVYCAVTVDDGSPPDKVWAGVYKTDSPSEPVPGDPDTKALELNYDDTGATGNGPYYFQGCISVPQGTNCGLTCATLKDVILAVWAERDSGMSSDYRRVVKWLKGFDVYVDCGTTGDSPLPSGGGPAGMAKAKTNATKKKRAVKKKRR